MLTISSQHRAILQHPTWCNPLNIYHRITCKTNVLVLAMYLQSNVFTRPHNIQYSVLNKDRELQRECLPVFQDWTCLVAKESWPEIILQRVSLIGQHPKRTSNWSWDHKLSKPKTRLKCYSTQQSKNWSKSPLSAVFTKIRLFLAQIKAKVKNWIKCI